MVTLFTISFDGAFMKDDPETRRTVLEALPGGTDGLEKLIDAAGIADRIPEGADKDYGRLCDAVSRILSVMQIFDYLYSARVDAETLAVSFNLTKYGNSDIIDEYTKFFCRLTFVLEDGSTMHTSCDELEEDEIQTISGGKIDRKKGNGEEDPDAGNKVVFTRDGNETLNGGNLLPFLTAAVKTVKGKDAEWRDRTAEMILNGGVSLHDIAERFGIKE